MRVSRMASSTVSKRVGVARRSNGSWTGRRSIASSELNRSTRDADSPVGIRERVSPSVVYSAGRIHSTRRGPSQRQAAAHGTCVGEKRRGPSSEELRPTRVSEGAEPCSFQVLCVDSYSGVPPTPSGAGAGRRGVRGACPRAAICVTMKRSSLQRYTHCLAPLCIQNQHPILQTCQSQRTGTSSGTCFIAQLKCCLVATSAS